MNLDKAKSQIKDLLGSKVLVKVNIGRNKEECFEGIISETYPSIFLIKSNKYNRSYSYSDILTKDIILKKI